MKTNKILNYLFYFSVMVFIIGFNFHDNSQGGWYLQTMPNLGGKSLNSVVFLDSFTGYASARQQSDSSYILKTTNGGDNWEIIHRSSLAMINVKILNINTGFTCGAYLFKTTNGGYNWEQVNAPPISPEDFYAIDENIIWIISSEGMTGGVFRTTNGGQSWTQQLAAGGDNPDKIYMYNARIGFIVDNPSNPPNLRKTTNGGESWFTIMNEGFNDMYFIDSLTGWKCWSTLTIKKTTNGGINWITYNLPPEGGVIDLSMIRKMHLLNNDTIWGAGSRGYTSLGFRGLLYLTTNGGLNWGYQLPDINSIPITRYWYIYFTNKYTGWSYSLGSGVHTTTGGDTTIYTSIKQISNEVPMNYILEQNYPNPFNQFTIINVQCLIGGKIKLKVYDIAGKVVKIILDEYKPSGTYSIRFNTTGLSSGIYFYSLIVDGKVLDTKKATLIK